MHYFDIVPNKEWHNHDSSQVPDDMSASFLHLHIYSNLPDVHV